MEYLSGENFVNFNFRQSYVSWVIIFVSEEIRRLLQQTVILNYSPFEEFDLHFPHFWDDFFKFI